MEKIQILGLSFSIFSLVAFVWNISHSKTRKINGTSASFFFAIFVGIALLLDPKKIAISGLEYEKIKQEATKAENARIATQDALQAVKEVLAIQEWNQGRIPGDPTEAKTQVSHSLKIFKEIYGDEYKSKLQQLANKGLLKMTDKERLEYGIHKNIPPSTSPLHFEKNLDQIRQ